MSQFIFTDQFPGVSTGATKPPATTLHSLNGIETTIF